MDVTDECVESENVVVTGAPSGYSTGNQQGGGKGKVNGLQHDELQKHLHRLMGFRNKALEKLSEDDNLESENEESETKSESEFSEQNGTRSDTSDSDIRNVPSKETTLEIADCSDIPQPKVIIFDLDYTLWPFWIDRRINVEPPFCRVPDGRIYDAAQREIKAYPDIDNILKRLSSHGFILGAASESFFKDDVISLVKHFGWDDHLKYIEVFPGSKITHFVRIKRRCGIDFTEWLYFDDETDRLREVVNTCLGVTCVLADRGVSEEVLDEGFKTYANRHIKGNLFEGPYCSENTKSRSRRGSRSSVDNAVILPNAKLLSRRRGSCWY